MSTTTEKAAAVEWIPSFGPGDFARRWAEIAEARASVARHSLSLWVRWLLNTGAILAGDTAALAAAAALAVAMRRLAFGGAPTTPFLIVLVPAWWLVAAAGKLVPGWGLSAADHLRRQVSLLTGLFGLGGMLLNFTSAALPGARMDYVLMWLLAIVLVPLGRMLVRGVLCSHRCFGAPAVIFGQGGYASEVGRHLSDPALGYAPVGLCCDDAENADGALPVLGGLDEPRALAPVAIIVGRGLSDATRRQLIARAMSTYRKLLIIPELGDVPSLWVSPRDIDGSVALEISQTLLSPFATTVKRVVDLALVVSTLPLWLPVCWLVAALIWIEDQGNPVFRQTRAGRDGRPFYAYKFRTMVTDAENVLQSHLAADPALRSEWEREFKLRHDPRITRIGRFLRRTSLDELPQLINVLAGEMALVGPRPLPAYHLEKLSEETRELRSRMRPGLTGLWQVSGRSDVGTDGMSRWDPYYVRNWSIWLDIVILVRTIRVVLVGSGAR